MKPYIIAILVVISMGLSGVFGWFVKDYQQCKFEVAAYQKPILGDDQ